MYRVVKCGVSGHNIRAYASLKAPTVGMIFSDQNVTSDEQVNGKFIANVCLKPRVFVTFRRTISDELIYENDVYVFRVNGCTIPAKFLYA